jgi:heme-binding NEAT domain protein
MNNRNVTFAIAAIMTTISAISVGFVAPQQALAYHHHHNNAIKVNQKIGQLNNCAGTKDDGEEPGETGNLEREEVEEVSSPTVCLNTGDNQVDISR